MGAPGSKKPPVGRQRGLGAKGEAAQPARSTEVTWTSTTALQQCESPKAPLSFSQPAPSHTPGSSHYGYFALSVTFLRKMPRSWSATRCNWSDRSRYAHVQICLGTETSTQERNGAAALKMATHLWGSPALTFMLPFPSCGAVRGQAKVSQCMKPWCFGTSCTASTF